MTQTFGGRVTHSEFPYTTAFWLALRASAALDPFASVTDKAVTVRNLVVAPGDDTETMWHTNKTALVDADFVTAIPPGWSLVDENGKSTALPLKVGANNLTITNCPGKAKTLQWKKETF